MEVFTTEGLAVELAATGTLKTIYAFGIFRIVYANANRGDFDQRVAALKAQLGNG